MTEADKDLHGFQVAGEGEATLAQALKPDDAAPQVAPGEAAKHPFAILYQGPWETLFDGTCVAVRRHARALSSTGVPVLLQSFTNMVINDHGMAEPSQGSIKQGVLDEVFSLTKTSAAKLIPRIKHMVVRDASHLTTAIIPRYVTMDAFSCPKEAIEARQGLFASTIMYTVWERDRIGQDIARQLSRCGQIWVPCEQNARMLVDSGVPDEKVFVVPHPFDPDADICKLVRRPSVKSKRFYAIGGWEPRKGFDLLLHAFVKAFCPGDDVHLTIKYNGGKWDNYPTPEEAVQNALSTEWAAEHGWSMNTLANHLHMWEGREPADKILKLHFDNNIYVSPGHGEAWCLPAFDAKCAGNRMVHVAYGGTAEFCDCSDVGVKFELGEVHPSYSWEPGAQWANYHVFDLATAMRKVEAPRCYARSPDFEDKFNMKVVGQEMLRLALQVAKTVPKAHDYLREQAVS